jgi:multiple sugar transport system substrate-binding protein
MTSAAPRRPDRRAWLAAGLACALPVRAAARRKLTVAAFPLLDEIVKAALPRWQRLHPDVEVQVVSRQYVDHHTAMTTALSTSVYLPDVMALESSYVGRFSQGGGLEDLAQPSYGIDRFRSRFVRYAYDQAINRRGQVVAAPTDIGPGTLLYRVDLLAKAGLSEADLTPSWEAYVDAGIKLKAATGAYLISNAQAVKDIVIRSGLRPGEGLYFDQDSRVLVNSPRFVRAFELARKVRRHKLDARVNAWSNEWAEGFKRGTLATDLSGAWMVGQMANWVAPGTKGLWRAAQLPAQTFVSYGGSFYAIPRRATPENKALAWELIQLLTLDRDLQFAAFKSQDAFPALLETLDDPFFEQPLPFLGGQSARVLWRDAARRITATQVHKQANFADEVIGTELDNVLDHDKDIGRALADAERLLVRRAHR